MADEHSSSEDQTGGTITPRGRSLLSSESTPKRRTATSFHGGSAIVGPLVGPLVPVLHDTRNPLPPSQKVRPDPPGTYMTVSNTSPSEKVLGSLG